MLNRLFIPRELKYEYLKRSALTEGAEVVKLPAHTSISQRMD